MIKPIKPAGLETPGLKYRKRSTHWELYWIARQDLVKRGFRPSTVRLAPSSEDKTAELIPDEWLWIASECQRLHAEMLKWGNGGVTDDPHSLFNGTFGSLIKIFQTDADSPFQEVRFGTRKVYVRQLTILDREVGDARLAALDFRDFKRWHERFLTSENFVGRASNLMNMVRGIIGFGKLLKLGNCRDLSETLGEMVFESPKKRKEFLTAAQAVAIRRKAHERGQPSIALAQAIQFELMFRQKDVLGEWVPVAEPGMSDVADGPNKWLHGLTWRDIDSNLILRKRISKSIRGKRGVITGSGDVAEFDLHSYPMILEELALATKKSGPLIVNERTGLPWRARRFESEWRKIATAVGVPSTVQNRDSRAGGITEATDAGATIEQAQRHAGHATPAMTARYSRTHVEVKNKVAQLRTKNRTA